MGSVFISTKWLLFQDNHNGCIPLSGEWVSINILKQHNHAFGILSHVFCVDSKIAWVGLYYSDTATRNYTRVSDRKLRVKALWLTYFILNLNVSTEPRFLRFSHINLHTKCTSSLWGRVTHICVRRLTAIGSDSGLSPGRRQAIIWINAGILLIVPLGTNFSEILNEIHTLKKMNLKMSSGKWRPFCLGFSVLHPKHHVHALLHPNDNLRCQQWCGKHFHGMMSSWQAIVWWHQLNMWISSQISNIRRTKSQSLNVTRLVLQLSLSNPLKPCINLRLKM